MKMKSLICLLATTLSMHAFASEIYKGHMLDHKEWTTGNAKASFLLSKVPLNALKNNLTGDSTGTKVSNVSNDLITSKTGQIVDVNGSHYIYVYNDSESTKKYTFTYGICAELNSNETQCAYYSSRIELDAGGYFSDSHLPQLHLSFDKAGEHQTYAFTQIANENGFDQAMSQSISKVVVTD